MSESRVDRALRLAEENNRMLKDIISYINYINGHSEEENLNDFGRNIIANMISTSVFENNVFNNNRRQNYK